MSDLTTDEVRDTWVDNQLVGIPTAHVVRLVPGLQIHFDRWLGRERQQARHEVLTDLRAKVEGMGLCVERDDGDECLCGPVELNSARVTLDKVLDLLAEAGHD